MVRLGNREVGDGAPCFITLEAGATHDGVDSAKRLVDAAADAGADAIKFQILDPDRLMADSSVEITYQILKGPGTEETETVSDTLHELLSRRALDRDGWRAVKAHADRRGLAFFATVGFADEVEFVHELGCHSIKIASADVNHWPLIREAARTGLCIQLDTGAASIGEVEMAVDVVLAEGGRDVIIHHCPTGYPARADGVNLNVIQTLKRMFPFPIAFSDHTPGWEMDIAAVALGANLIEKTISEDRATRSIEHMFSLEPRDLRPFIDSVRAVETALGDTRRVLTAEDAERRKSARRSVHLAASARAGQRLGDVAVEFRRPGHGMAPNEYEALVDRRVRRDLDTGHRLDVLDLE